MRFGSSVLLVIGMLSGCGGSTEAPKNPGTIIKGGGSGGSRSTDGSDGTAGMGTASKGNHGTGGVASSMGGSGGVVGTGTAGMGMSSGAGGMGMASGTGGMGGGTSTPGATLTCAAYPTTSIAAIRNPAAPGCYELSHVGLVARTDSQTDPRIYVQDMAGGDYSAILAKCSASAMHACAAPVAAKIQTLYDTLEAGAKISVRGYYQYLAATGFEQFYIEDIIEDGGTLPRREPITLTVADLKRDARTAAKWFQRANVSIPAQDPLVMYDFSPADLMLGASSACPEFAGFGMIPQSAGVAAAAGCSGTTNPPARAADPNEILIGRHFFNQLLFSTDCACAGTSNQMLLTADKSVVGTVRGYLILEQDAGGTESYQVFEAAADQTFLFK